MRKPSPLLNDVYLRVALVASAALLLIAFAMAYRKFAPIDHLLVIQFEGGRGIDLLGSKYDVFSLLGAGLLVCGINTWLSHVLYGKVRALSYLLAFFTVFFAALLLLVTAVIIRVN